MMNENQESQQSSELDSHSLLSENGPPMAECPMCGELSECERTHNGIGYVWHMVHCGWGHDQIHPVNR